MTREEAWELLTEYNQDEFHLLHAKTVENTMRYFARELGFADEEDFWGICGLLHDIDFELYPEQHCTKAPELLKAGGVGDDDVGAARLACAHGVEDDCGRIAALLGDDFDLVAVAPDGELFAGGGSERVACGE